MIILRIGGPPMFVDPDDGRIDMISPT